jgi:hypothetical protein
MALLVLPCFWKGGIFIGANVDHELDRRGKLPERAREHNPPSIAKMADKTARLVDAISERLEKSRGQLSDRDVVLLEDCRRALLEYERTGPLEFMAKRSSLLLLVIRLLEFFSKYGHC